MPFVHELAYLVGLVYALPAVHLLIEQRNQLGVGVQGQVAAELPRRASGSPTATAERVSG